MTAREYDLGPAELEVLKVLWEEGPGNVRAVLETLVHRGRSVAYTTVQTMLTRLEQKGFVRSDKSGPAFVYRAAITREQISRSRLKKLLEQLYDGAAGPLVLHLVKTQRLRPEELDELHRLVERLDATGRPPGRSAAAGPRVAPPKEPGE
ncbi:MAG: BlaI/MecI/CopY family transcriptional regulator [Planctomycetota bacterium]